MPDILQKVEGPFFRSKKAAAYVDCTEVTLRRMVADGLLPPPIRVGARSLLFSKPEIDAALSACARKGY